MTYRVLDDNDLSDYSTNKGAERWADVVEGTLNYFEGMGFLLVAVDPGPQEGGSPLYILRNFKD